jgi:CheY-like chemotaxis protein
MIGVDLLEEAGYRVTEAGDAGEALRILETDPHAVTILVTDVDMPGPMDGMELARLVDQRWPWIRLVVTSGAKSMSNSEVPDDGRFLPKPWAGPEIIRAVAASGTPSDPH